MITTSDQVRKMILDIGSPAVIFTNGCFDIFHTGHLKVIKKCRELAGPFGYVVIGLNSDESVKRLKGPSRPILELVDRALLLDNLVDVDFVVPFEEDTPQNIINDINPTIIVKGGDYKEQDVVGRERSDVVIVPLIEELSTTKIIERIKNG